MKKLLVGVVFILCISCNNDKPNTSNFDKQMEEIKAEIELLNQDLIISENQTKRAIGLAEHFRDLYFREIEKTDSLKNELKKISHKQNFKNK